MSDFSDHPAGFQIEYEIKESSLGSEIGLGIFTKQFIKSGELIWKYSSIRGGEGGGGRGQNVVSYSNEEEVMLRLDQLNQIEKEFFVSHIYLYDNKVNEILDDAKYWNHVRTYCMDLWIYYTGILSLSCIRL